MLSFRFLHMICIFKSISALRGFQKTNFHCNLTCQKYLIDGNQHLLTKNSTVSDISSKKGEHGYVQYSFSTWNEFKMVSMCPFPVLCILKIISAFKVLRKTYLQRSSAYQEGLIHQMQHLLTKYPQFLIFRLNQVRYDNFKKACSTWIDCKMISFEFLIRPYTLTRILISRSFLRTNPRWNSRWHIH